LERGKPEYPEKNLSEQSREPTTNSTHMTPGLGIEPGTHWWEASTLTTPPTLHPLIYILFYILFRHFEIAIHALTCR